MDLEFEWDEPKRRRNIRIHGVDFLEARKIFRGPIIAEIDDREDYGEERYRAIGDSGRMILVVIFTKQEDALRLISAWKASRNEEKLWYQTIFDG